MHIILSSSCWLSPVPFYAALLGPVFLVMVFNTVIFILLAHKLMQKGKVQSTKKETTKTRLRRVVAVMIALGLTWLFALLTINDSYGVGLVFQILFTLFNTLQGLFVFVFYIVLNSEIRALWKNKLENTWFHKCLRNTRNYDGQFPSGGAYISMYTICLLSDYWTYNSLYLFIVRLLKV